MSSLSSAASSKTPPAAYPSCHLCRRTRPLPTFNLDTLDPLPSEIRSLIWDFVISTRCRSAMVKLLCISAQLYEQIAPQLYSSVVLDERTTEGLYYGLWKREGETGDTLPGIGDEQEAKESGKAAWARLEANLCVIDTIHGPSTPDNPPPWTEAEAQIVLRRFTTPPMTASPFLRQPVRKLALFNLVCTLSIGDEVGMHLIGTANRMQADIHMRPVWFERLQVGVRLGNDDADVQAVRGRGTLRNGATFGYVTQVVFRRPLVETLWAKAASPESFTDMAKSVDSLAHSCSSREIVFDGSSREIVFEAHFPEPLPGQRGTRSFVQGVSLVASFAHSLSPSLVHLYNVHMCDIIRIPFAALHYVFWLSPDVQRECCASNKESVVKHLCWCFGPSGTYNWHYDNLFEPRCMIYLGCNTNEQEVEAGVNQRLDGDRQRWDEAVARRAIGYDDGNHQPNSYKY